MPSLLDALAPVGGNISFQDVGASRKRLESLLLMPPAPEIASAIQKAIRENWQLDVSMTWKTIHSWAQVQQLIRFGPQGNGQAVASFADILRCTRSALAAFDSSSLQMERYRSLLIQIATSKCGINRHIPQDAFLSGCQELEQCVGGVVLDGSELLPESPLQRLLDKLDGSPHQWTSGNIASMEAFLMHYEGQHSGKLNAQALPPAVSRQLCHCKMSLLAAIDHFFAAHEFCNVMDRGASLRFDASAQMLSLFSARMTAKSLSKYADAALPAAVRLISFDSDLGDSYTRPKCFLTQAIADAQRQYVVAHESAMECFDEALIKAWEYMCRPTTSTISLVLCILMAKEFTEWGHLISCVAEASFMQGWTLPDIASPRKALDIKDMWPYWLDASKGNCVKNDVLLNDEMAVLSGPNMAGKSTFLRSLTAVALLANCGLPIPAAEGSTVPQYQSFMYRNFRGDSPAEGRSGFALEAHEMSVVLRRGSAALDMPLPCHFVCIDEFGKGTEDRHATALCASILQLLDKGNFSGVFATHQHALFEDQLRLFRSETVQNPLLKRTQQICLMTESMSTRLKELKADQTQCSDSLFHSACHKVSRGINKTSLAFQVARSQGLTIDMITQSVDWRKDVDKLHTEQEIRYRGMLHKVIEHTGRHSSRMSTACLDQIPAPSCSGLLLPDSLQTNATVPYVPSPSIHAPPDNNPDPVAHSFPVLPTPDRDVSSVSMAADSSRAIWAQANSHAPVHLSSHTPAPDCVRKRTFQWGGATEGSIPYSDCGSELPTPVNDHQGTAVRQAARGMDTLVGIALEQEVAAVEATLTDVLKDACGVTDAQIHLLQVTKGQTPGVRFLKMSCVYILVIWSEAQELQYYVGESDNIRKRLARHTSDAHRRFNGHIHCALVVGLSGQGKSSARKAEAYTIQELVRQGLRLASVHDVRNCSFGAAQAKRALRGS
eukprot:jgi/Ulvmu1/4209/UM019_0188.1